jgi:hypothetical protein
MTDLTNEDLLMLYEEILNHLKYLKSNILEEEKEENGDGNE